MNSTPTLSIITVNYNNAVGLEKTIVSVTGQNYPGIEFLVIDGGSTDESVEVIKSYNGKISHWISEKDNGVYQAMNKGIKNASHDYVLFLNSGDEFCSDKSMQQLAGASAGEDIVYGDIVIRESTRDWVKDYPANLTFSYFLKDSLPHPCTLIKRSLFSSIGLYNEHFKIISDWEFFIKAICKYNASYRHVSVPISVFTYDGLSSKSENQGLVWEERDAVLKKDFNLFLPDYHQHQQVEKSLQLVSNSRIQRLMNKLRDTAIYKALKR